jgi:formate dehydrogenase subunit gamma
MTPYQQAPPAQVALARIPPLGGTNDNDDRETPMRFWSFVLSTLAVALVMTITAITPADAQSSVRPPENATTNSVPGQPTDGAGPAPSNYENQLWNRVRNAEQGTVSIPDTKSGYLVDDSGWAWRLARSGEYYTWPIYAFAGMLGLLLVFFLVRGRIKVSKGMSGSTITRFTDIERLAHWLLAIPFLILAVTGLNVIYGKDVLMPLMGKEAFATLSVYAKYVHNYVAFAFMLGVVLTFVLWVRHNLPAREDITWMLKGGGILSSAHPPARKFNAGQKILFWLVFLSGVSLSLSGIALLFPYEFPMFAKTFSVLNTIATPLGYTLPTELTPNQEQQYAALWHGILAVVMTTVVIAHIYIGSIGMQGAFDAMGTGEVDVNWAKDHHSIWAEEVLERERREVLGGRAEPAE